MRILITVHKDDAGPGVFLDVFKELDVTADIWEPVKQPEAPADLSVYDAILPMGSVANPPEVDRYPWISTELDVLRTGLRQGTPMLGVCFGSQMLAEASGTRTRYASIPEVGFYEVKLTEAAETDPLFKDLPKHLVNCVRVDSLTVERSIEAIDWHEFEVPLPRSATALAQSDTCLQAYRLGSNVWGVQFHPEVTVEDFGSWLDGSDTDSSFQTLELDVSELRAEAEQKMERWNEFGRTIVRRFLAVVADGSASH